MRRPTLHLTVGLPCAGKTTAARRLEAEHGALRLTKDEWVKALYGPENPEAAQAVIEGRLVEIGLRVLETGTDVVIDVGLYGVGAIDPPPAGFTSWDEWRSTRWPASVD